MGACIILEEGAELTEEDVRDYARTKIARFKVPKHVFFVDEFPHCQWKDPEIQTEGNGRETFKEKLARKKNQFKEFYYHRHGVKIYVIISPGLS